MASLRFLFIVFILFNENTDATPSTEHPYISSHLYFFHSDFDGIWKMLRDE